VLKNPKGKIRTQIFQYMIENTVFYNKTDESLLYLWSEKSYSSIDGDVKILIYRNRLDRDFEDFQMEHISDSAGCPNLKFNRDGLGEFTIRFPFGAEIFAVQPENNFLKIVLFIGK
jgi:hypothetical protein